METHTCPKCGAGLSVRVLDGLCPRCLAGLALGDVASAENQAPRTPPPQPAADAAVRVFGDYELLKQIAHGAKGAVFKARQVSLDRVVAVKMLPLASEAFRRRFRAETDAAAANLTHPNIVAIHDVGEVAGQFYFAMDYVEGRSLAALVKDHPLPAPQAAECARKMALTLQHAHDSGIVHADLKPSKVIIDTRGEPRITDFGLAARETDGSESSAVGQEPEWPGYLPPERAGGEQGDLGPACDVYSLGAILYHLLTGRPPFVGETPRQTLGHILKAEPVPPRWLNPGTPPDLEAICLKCLQKKPRRRFGSAQELADDLGRFLRGEPTHSRAAKASGGFRLWCRRKPALAAALALLVVIAAGSTAATIFLARNQRLARWTVYATEMNQAHNDWQEGSFAQAFDILQRQIPRRGEPDFRGFEWRHLWKLSQGTCAFKLPWQSKVVGAIMFSPDGNSVATFRWDKSNTLKVWDIKTREERFRIDDATSFGGFSANGKWLVAGGADGSVTVYDAESGKLIFSIPRVGAIAAFGPQGNVVVAIDTNRNVVVQRLEMQRPATIVTRAAPRDFEFSQGPTLAVSPDGHFLAVIRPGRASDREDNGVEIWDAESPSAPKFLPIRREIRTLQFSADGRVLAVGDGEGWVHLWNWATPEARSFQAHEPPIMSLAFSPDGRTLATGSSDENIQLWDVATLAQKAKSFDGQMGAAWSLAFSPDGKFLAAGGRDSPVRFWDLEAADPTDLVTGLKSDKFGNFAFAPDGRLMAGGCADNTVRIWEVASLTERFRLTNASYAVSFTGDGKKLLAASSDGAAFWWDFRADRRQSVPAYGELGQISCVDLSTDRRIAAVGRGDGAMQLIEIDSGNVLGTYRGHDDAVLAVSLFPDGARLASGSRDKTIRIWKTKNPERSLRTSAEQPGAVSALAVSKDARTLISGCTDNSITFWDTRRLVGSLASVSRHESAVRTIAFSPDDKILASGGEDNAVKLWDVVNRRQLASFKFDGAVRLVAFSPDGNNLAVVSEKGTLRLLRAASLTEADEEYLTFYKPRVNNK